MTLPLDDRYFEWLYSHIGSVRNRDPVRSRWELAKQLYKREFVWLVPNDDNRVEDGLELRREFVETQGLGEVDQDWMDLGCSVLEMLVAFCNLLSFESGNSADEWYARLLENLGLLHLTDAEFTNETAEVVDEVLDTFIFRNYQTDGRGGLFPLDEPHEDQTKVELWYQAAAYILEKMHIL